MLQCRGSILPLQLIVKSPFFILLATLFLPLCSCAEKSDEIRERASEKTVIATANGIPIYLADLERDVTSGRLGGSTELIMDELISFALALKEKDLIERHRIEDSKFKAIKEIRGEFTTGSRSLRKEGEAFLNLLFSKETVCSSFEPKKVFDAFESLWGKKISFEKNFNDPGVKEEVESFLCEKERKRQIRQYLKDLRKNAIIKIKWKEIRDAGF